MLGLPFPSGTGLLFCVAATARFVVIPVDERGGRRRRVRPDPAMSSELSMPALEHLEFPSRQTFFMFATT
jgi:hypothetical protein